MKKYKKLLVAGLALTIAWANPVIYAQDDQTTVEESAETEQAPMDSQDLDLFNQIFEANKEFSKIEGEMNVDLTLTNVQQSQEAPVKVSGTYQIQQSPFAGYFDIDVQNENGEIEKVQVTMVDGYAYIFSQDKWTVQKMEVDEAIQEANNSNSLEFSQKLFEQAGNLEEAEGGYQIHYDFTKDLTGLFEGIDLKQKILEEFEKNAGKYEDSLGQTPEQLQTLMTQVEYFLEMVDVNKLISDVMGALGQVNLTYNKDSLKLSDVELVTNFSARELFSELIDPIEGLSGQSITQDQDILVDLNLSLKVNQYDGDFTITKPEDAPTYEEYQQQNPNSQGTESMDQSMDLESLESSEGESESFEEESESFEEELDQMEESVESAE